MLRNVTTPYEPREKVLRAFLRQSLVELKRDPEEDDFPHLQTLNSQQL